MNPFKLAVVLDLELERAEAGSTAVLKFHRRRSQRSPAPVALRENHQQVGYQEDQ
jgi:hypothetical protein